MSNFVEPLGCTAEISPTPAAAGAAGAAAGRRQGAQRIGKLLDAALDGMAPIGVLYLVEIVLEPLAGNAIRERNLAQSSAIC